MPMRSFWWVPVLAFVLCACGQENAVVAPGASEKVWEQVDAYEAKMMQAGIAFDVSHSQGNVKVQVSDEPDLAQEKLKVDDRLRLMDEYFRSLETALRSGALGKRYTEMQLKQRLIYAHGTTLLKNVVAAVEAKVIAELATHHVFYDPRNALWGLESSNSLSELPARSCIFVASYAKHLRGVYHQAVHYFDLSKLVYRKEPETLDADLMDGSFVAHAARNLRATSLFFDPIKNVFLAQEIRASMMRTVEEQVRNRIPEFEALLASRGWRWHMVGEEPQIDEGHRTQYRMQHRFDSDLGRRAGTAVAMEGLILLYQQQTLLNPTDPHLEKRNQRLGAQIAVVRGMLEREKRK